MSSSKITSVFLLIFIILSKSDALARVLLAGENPTPYKEIQTADKEKNQNPDPQKPAYSQLNSNDGQNIKGATQSKLTEDNTKDQKQKLNKDTSGNKDKIGDIKKDIDGKSKSIDNGKEENIDPSKSGGIGKSQGLKGIDDILGNESKERDDPSQGNKESKEINNLSQGNSKNNDKTEGSKKSSQENGKKKVDADESNDPSKNEENNGNGKPKERNDGKMKENNATDGQHNGKMNNESKQGNNNSNNQEKVKKNEEKTQTSDPSKSREKDKKDASMKANIGPYKSKEKDKSDGEKESKDNDKIVVDKQKVKLPNENESILDKPELDTCGVSLQKCQEYELVACLQHSKIDTGKLVISVHNTGEDSLTVHITVPPSMSIDSKMLNLGKHSNQKINITSYTTKSLKVVLNAGKGNCTIQIGIGPSFADWFQQFPAYASQVTPTYVGCFLFITVIIVGVMFGFCKLRKRGKRVDNGVQYEQLEMGSQIQSNSVVVEASTVDGWNQGWDDDWDEEEEISGSNGNLSPAGLSSRPGNKRSDWDVDWDD